MGKKYIVLQAYRKKYRLFSEDIKTVFIKHSRRIPHVPQYHHQDKTYDDDTEEEELTISPTSQNISLEWFIYFLLFLIFYYWITNNFIKKWGASNGCMGLLFSWKV